nr:MAG: hypothetical protein DIU67_06030 [Actinomycetota bacterium]
MKGRGQIISLLAFAMLSSACGGGSATPETTSTTASPSTTAPPSTTTLTAVPSTTTTAVEIPYIDLTRQVADFLATTDLPAMGAAIVTIDGEMAGLGVAGERRLGSGIPVEEGDVWSLGSNAKAITALAAGMMVDAGLITWDTTVEDVFPELAGTMLDVYRVATLRDLLGHGAGIVNASVPGVDGTPIGGSVTPATQREQAVAWALAQQPAVTPGTHHYSNLGYVTAAVMLERAAGMPFEEWAVANIAAPLGATTFGYGPHVAPGASDQPVPHQKPSGGGWMVREAHENTPFRRPSGGAFASLGDWGLIVAEMMKASRGDSDLVTAETGRTLVTPITRIQPGYEYAMGWGLTDPGGWPGGTAWYHAGSNNANLAVVWAHPEAGFAVLVVANGADADGEARRAVDALARAVRTTWQQAAG